MPASAKKRFFSLVTATAQKVWKRFDTPVPALPVDIFRIGVGTLSAVYFWHIRRDVRQISSAEGYIDHDLLLKLFPYTRMGLLNPKVSDKTLRALYLAAVASSLSVAGGVGIRPNALFLYTTAVSTYRHNFIAMYVDDAIMHLALFWMMLLPAGNTLTLNKNNRQDWRTATVPGFAVRAFLANLSLIYLAAGLWKWNSPLWKQGFALYAALKMPISRAPKFWQPQWQPIMQWLSHFGLLLEPVLAALPLLPNGSRTKYALGGSMFAFHAGIVGTLRIPYANIACMAALPLLFRDEIMQATVQPAAPSAKNVEPISSETRLIEKGLATTVISLLTLANIWRIRERHPAPTQRHPLIKRLRQLLGHKSELNHHRNPWQALLWALGLAQSYRLMDWIDDRNWHIYYEGEEQDGTTTRPFDADLLFPITMRNVFLNSYIQNQSWMKPPAADLAELQASLLTRYVNFFARQTPNTNCITIYTVMARITQENIDLRDKTRTKLLQFSIKDGVPTIYFMQLNS